MLTSVSFLMEKNLSTDYVERPVKLDIFHQIIEVVAHVITYQMKKKAVFRFLPHNKIKLSLQFRAYISLLIENKTASLFITVGFHYNLYLYIYIYLSVLFIFQMIIESQ